MPMSPPNATLDEEEPHHVFQEEEEPSFSEGRRSLDRSSSDSDTEDIPPTVNTSRSIGINNNSTQAEQSDSVWRVYKSVLKGDKEEVLAALRASETQVKWGQILHVAVNAGQGELIADILPHCKDVIECKNSKGDLPFHSAAKACKLNVLKALTNLQAYCMEEYRPLLGQGNASGDTALHIALKTNQLEMAEHLVSDYSLVSYRPNLKQITPLYLAIKAGYTQLVRDMIRNQRLEDDLLTSKSVVHAAIEVNDIEILKDLLETHGRLIQLVDEEGRRPLSYAAYVGFIDGVDYLKQFETYAYMPDTDNDESFAIHRAASGGQIEAIRELFTMQQLLNGKSQNILHVAAKCGQSNVVTHLLRVKEFESVINQKDEDGNTPLHLAAKHFHPRVTYILTRKLGVALDLENEDGLTALDLAEIGTGLNRTFEERLTWMALIYVDAPRSTQATRKSYYKYKKSLELKSSQSSLDKNDKNKLEDFKDRIDTQILVGTLVTTVAFAAGFTLPGGYIQSDGDPHIGNGVLVRKWAFEVFVISNTAAMFTALIAVVTLLWAQLGELKLMLVAVKFALLVLGFSLTMMSVAFTMGLFVVLRNLPWLSYVVLGMGCFFLITVLFLFVPLYNPSYIRNRIKRFFFTGIFLLLLLLCEKSTPKYAVKKKK